MRPGHVYRFLDDDVGKIEAVDRRHDINSFLHHHFPASDIPRQAFEAWQETVRGLARAWTAPEIDAAIRLRTAVLEVQQNRQIYELSRQLTLILQDKDVLLQQNAFLIGEVNHRVQNSLQLVSSYLALQARKSENPNCWPGWKKRVAVSPRRR